MDESENSSDIKNYKYNPDLNNIEITDIPFKDFNYKEKTFLFYNKNVDYLLPDFNRQHPEVTFFVKNKSRFEKVNYLPKQELNENNNYILTTKKLDKSIIAEEEDNNVVGFRQSDNSYLLLICGGLVLILIVIVVILIAKNKKREN